VTFETDDNYSIRFKISNNSSANRFDSKWRKHYSHSTNENGGDCRQVVTMVWSAARDVRASSSGASGNSLVTRVEAARSVRSRSTIAIAASIVACRSALPSACAQNVSGRQLLILRSTDLSPGKLEKVVEFGWSGKVRGNYFLEKSGKMKNWCHQMSDFKAKKMHKRVRKWGSLQRSPRLPSFT